MRRVGRLHVITDETLQARFSHSELAQLAIEGGADTIQYREKRPLSTRHLVAVATQVAEICRAAGVACIVDDRADVAFAVGAAGVHVGREDLPADQARRLLGDGFLIGGTANGLAEARAVFATPVDYIGVGPVFGTRSKVNPAPRLGLDALRAIVAESPVPVIAIGNIAPDRVAEVLEAGAHGVAVLSGVTCAADPAAAAARYAEALASFLGGRAGST
jgi:thiamine-phosphate pyrophosphorylase